MKHFALFCVLFLFAVSLSAAELSLKKTDEGYDVLLGGTLFASYLTDYKGTPIVYPIYGPGGQKMTRDFPMSEHSDNSEAKDHPHHRSLWFTHGEVNDCNFWMLNAQKIVHRKFDKTESSGSIAEIITQNDWLDKKEQPLCQDVRTLRFGQLNGKNGAVRYIDFDITVKAVQDSVIFRDTKEGTFGIRVPGTMDLTAKKRNPLWGGHIVNAEGIKDEETWGKRSAWVDYFGPVDGKTAGIAVLNHPSSFRYPTYWHVRDYGLYAANPFGIHDFEKKSGQPGEHKLKNGETFTLRYRVLFHNGTADEADIADAFRQYAE
ncbi:MAG: PmoA family protein [Planctomycetaceae bacterium]|jgi:hypothetical protein|nr:PmoA family protein [Planctomycetaceae bacterium]